MSMKGPKTYTQVKERLESVFYTAAGRDTKMTTFEGRIQQVTESVDAFMLELVQLYRGANPQAPDAELQKAVKRKFMQGISPELRRSIFVYNNNPYDGAVTYRTLLEHARNAQLNLIQSPTDTQAVNSVQSGTSANDEISLEEGN